MKKTLQLLLLTVCVAGCAPQEAVYWQSEQEEFQHAEAEVYEAALFIGRHFEQYLEPHVHVFDPDPDRPEVGGSYHGYDSPGYIAIYLHQQLDSFVDTALCHELIHMAEHVAMDVPRTEFKDYNHRYVMISEDDASALIGDCRTHMRGVDYGS